MVSRQKEKGKTNKMATSKTSPPTVSTNTITLASFLLLISVCAFSKSPTTAATFAPSPPAPPTVANCGPRVLPLAPCIPFVQGSAPAPTGQCCDNLRLIYTQQPSCLCLFLNGTALSTLPLNSTLALELPSRCSPQMSPSICSGTTVNNFPPGPTPPAQVSLGSSSAPSNAAPPAATVTPSPAALFGFGQSSTGNRLKRGGGAHSAMVLASTIHLMMKLASTVHLIMNYHVFF